MCTCICFIFFCIYLIVMTYLMVNLDVINDDLVFKKILNNYRNKQKLKKINQVVDTYFEQENLPEKYIEFFSFDNYLFWTNLKFFDDFKLNEKDISHNILKIILFFNHLFEHYIAKQEDLYYANDIIPKLCEYLNVKDNKELYSYLIELKNLNFLINSFLELNYVLSCNNKIIYELKKENKNLIKNNYCKKRIKYFEEENTNLISNVLNIYKASLYKLVKLKIDNKTNDYELLIESNKKYINSLNDKLDGYSKFI